MSKINDGGPAFPVPEENYISNGTYSNPGMTLRDWFAGQALVSMGPTVKAAPGATLQDVAESMASTAYVVADAMLAAREGEAP